MRTLLSISSLAGLLAFLGGCKDQPEQIPAYLQINPFVVNEQGGAAFHKITDGWVYVNGEYLGAYSLPASVPVLDEGTGEVIIFPGIKENGILTTPNIYPFFTRFEQSYSLVPGQTTVVQPVTAYDAKTVFTFEPKQSAFDDSSLPLENRDTDGGSAFELRTDGAFAGRSLFLDVNTEHPLIEIATGEVILPVNQVVETWVELHYKNDIAFELWLIGETGSLGELSQPIYSFNPSENWNKIYINIGSFVLKTQQDQYRLYFRASLPKDVNGVYKQTTGSVGLDNIRIVHF